MTSTKPATYAYRNIDGEARRFSEAPRSPRTSTDEETVSSRRHQRLSTFKQPPFKVTIRINDENDVILQCPLHEDQHDLVNCIGHDERAWVTEVRESMRRRGKSRISHENLKKLRKAGMKKAAEMEERTRRKEVEKRLKQIEKDLDKLVEEKLKEMRQELRLTAERTTNLEIAQGNNPAKNDFEGIEPSIRSFEDIGGLF